MKKRIIALGFLRFAGRFYKWAFRNIFRLTKRSDEHLKAIQQQKRAAEAARTTAGNTSIQAGN